MGQVISTLFKLQEKLAGLRSRSRVFLAPWSRSRLKKKTGAGAAWKK